MYGTYLKHDAILSEKLFLIALQNILLFTTYLIINLKLFPVIDINSILIFLHIKCT